MLDGERQQIEAHVLGLHGIEATQHERIGEENRVVAKSLRSHQHQTEHRPARIMPKKRDAEIGEADGARADPQAQPGQQFRRGGAAAHFAFHRDGDAFRFFGPPVQQQPTRTFRQISPEEKDAETEYRTQSECQSPADVGRKASGLQQQAGADRAQRGAHPETSIDAEIGATAIACGYQFLDRGIDRRVLAADSGTGQEAKKRECREIFGKGRSRRGEDINPERYEEKTLASEPVGEPTEQERAQHGAGEIGARRQSDLGIAELATMGWP